MGSLRHDAQDCFGDIAARVLAHGVEPALHGAVEARFAERLGDELACIGDAIGFGSTGAFLELAECENGGERGEDPDEPADRGNPRPPVT